MTYQVLFDQLPNGALPLYERSANSYLIAENGDDIIKVTNTDKIRGQSFELRSENEVYKVLSDLIERFEALDIASEYEIRTIIVAHRGFYILPVRNVEGEMTGLVYFIECAIIAIDVDIDQGHNFSETLQIPLSISDHKIEYIELNFNGLDSKADLKKIIEVAEIICA